MRSDLLFEIIALIHDQSVEVETISINIQADMRDKGIIDPNRTDRGSTLNAEKKDDVSDVKPHSVNRTRFSS